MPPTSIHLVFDHPSRNVRRRALRAFLADVTGRLGPGRGVTCLVSTDAELRRLNRTFRKKDHATDVLSFPSEPRIGAGFSLPRTLQPPSGFSSPLGELAISLDRATAQAKQLGHSLEEELRILILHGVLHLTGMDHESDHGEMAAAEVRWRKRLGLPAGLIERARA